MNQSEKFQRVKRSKFRWRRSRRFGFSRRWPETGCFGRFSGPRGPKWVLHFLTLTQKERRAGRAGCTQATLFPYDCGVSSAKTPFGPVSGAHGPKRVTGNGRKWPSATGRKAVAGPCMNQSEKFQWVKRSKFRWLRARLSRLFPWVAPKGPFWPFFGPRGVWGRSENADLAATRKLLLEMGPTQLDY